MTIKQFIGSALLTLPFAVTFGVSVKYNGLNNSMCLWGFLSS